MTRRCDLIWRWLLLLAVTSEAAIAAAVVAGAEIPIAVRVAVSTAAVVAVGYEVRQYRRHYRRRRGTGMPQRSARRAALGDVLPVPVLAAARLECAIWRGLARGVLRRPDIPEGAVGFSHHRTLAPVRWMGVAVLVLEVGVVHLVVPSGVLHIILLIVGLYSLVWILGYLLGSGPVRPHLVSADLVVLRTGLSTDVTVPTRSIQTARACRQSRPGMASVQLEGAALHLVDNGGTNLHLILTAPLPVTLPRGHATQVTDVCIWVDNPTDMANAIKQAAALRNGWQPTE